MLLAIDIGNTNIVIAVFKDNNITMKIRIKTDINKTFDEYGIIINQKLSEKNIKTKDIRGAMISSVVVELTETIKKMNIDYFNIESYVVAPTLKLGINIIYDNPKELGMDRIANAVSAYHERGGPTIIVDFGTATTFCYISANGDYEGGVIAPGINMLMESLLLKTSSLPKVELKKPEKTINTNTKLSMQSGIVNGAIGMTEHIIRNMKKEKNKEMLQVIATGGLSRVIASEIKEIEEIDENLTLKGLNRIYNMNK